MPVPITPTSNPSLADLSRSVSGANSLEELARPLLEMLHVATGLESTYLTSIDLKAGEQQVQFTLNRGAMSIPEGLTVPWGDTLCKRALDEEKSFCNDVAESWGDSDAARALGIKTYASAPVRTSDGLLVGTLCAAGGRSVELGDWAQSTLNMFSKMVSQYIERELLLQQLKAANSELMIHALTDALTGLPNRRAILDELGRMLARCALDGIPLLVGLVDLDDFKAINDTRGHHRGDQFLQAIGHRLGGAVRAADMVGRMGGDEFAVLAPGPHEGIDPGEAANALRQRLAKATAGRYLLGDAALDYAGASVGVVALHGGVDAETALRQADAAMYADKRSRKTAVLQRPS
ncbi:GGDEF domain-containing protein [Variovorax saccharolyticus]|uniref:GGDEF domain-containing protein n=1 Tax=Variovorax saccharolyticus TaxID=3053516 RepID=UPI0025749890|nr:sensor domain-containing diguanylate cyclase [Variovorax sp. J31P216]MDM0026076.1 sensor domain-containing diguanylate cyclase [Variovorax sp. J31P216]